MEIPNAYYRTSVKALILDETRTKFLLLEEENHKWDFPGGGLDFGETPQVCITRELHEECGLTATSVADNPTFFLAMKKDNAQETWVANVFYETAVADLAFTPSEECISLRFVSVEEVKDMPVYTSVARFAEMFAKEARR